jgi:hypothetical protein
LRSVGSRFRVEPRVADGVDATAVVSVEEARGAHPHIRLPERSAASVQKVAAREDNLGEIVSALLGCWPEPLLAVARRVGVTKAALDAYLARKGTLPDDTLSRLMAVLGLTFTLNGEHLADADRFVKSVERYVLFAGNTPRRVSRAYDFLIGGDRKAASVELVPAGHAPGHLWRYLVVMRQPDAPSLICFPRYGRSAEMLERGQLTWFHGRLAVDPAFYNAVEAMRAGVEQRPTRVLHAMRGLYSLRAADIAQIVASLRRSGR